MYEQKKGVQMFFRFPVTSFLRFTREVRAVVANAENCVVAICGAIEDDAAYRLKASMMVNFLSKLYAAALSNFAAQEAVKEEKKSATAASKVKVTIFIELRGIIDGCKGGG